MTEHFAGLDVSIAETAICVVDREGVVQLECNVPTNPEAIADALLPFRNTLRRAGHEAGALSPWLHPGLKALGVPAVCLETRHVRAAMSAQRNKTDATDAIGIAHIMRTGWFRQAHIKTDQAYRLRLLLIQRRNLKRKFLDLENTIRHSLKSFGVRLNKVGRGGFEDAVRTACAGDSFTAELMDCMLSARAALWREYLKLHRLVVRIVGRSELCRRYFGLTSQRWQSGSSIDVQGRISKAGDPDVRRALYEAASAMLTRFRGKTALKTWSQKIAKRCHRKGVVAVARKLAVVMHAMWRDGSEYADRPRADADPRRPRRARTAAADATSTHDEHAFMTPATAG